jgi:hypothetical protein
MLIGEHYVEKVVCTCCKTNNVPLLKLDDLPYTPHSTYGFSCENCIDKYKDEIISQENKITMKAYLKNNNITT